MSALAAALLKKIESRRARTGVVGLGYVGLPLLVELAKGGFHATGIDLATRKIDAIHQGMLIVLESMNYTGTTEEVVQPLLEATGLKAGTDFFLAFSPERVDPGN